jgi:small subunit ribosomal protein S1
MSDVPETQAAAPTSPATDEAGAAVPGGVPGGAVDTGRRIDPALLQRKVIRRGNDDRAAPGAEGDAPVVDAATIAARVQDAPQAPRGPRRVREVDGAALRGDGDRGPRREGAGGGGGGRGRRDGRDNRGPRKDGEGQGDRGPRTPRVESADLSGLDPIRIERTEPVEEFAAMFEANGKIDRRNIRVGDKVKALVVHIGTDTVFMQISGSQEAHASLAEFLDDKTGDITVAINQEVEAFVVGMKAGIQLSTKLGKDQLDIGMLEHARAGGIPVDGTITGANKGGYEVMLRGNARGFCPLGQIDINFVNDPTTMVGKTLQFVVKEIKENGRNIVLSRRTLLEKERKANAAKTLESLQVGAVLTGTVTRIQPFGVFVDLGGVDGMVPVMELGWGRVQDPGEVVKTGEQVTVTVVRIDDDAKRPGQKKISLSMKATQQDPMAQAATTLVPGSEHVGRVVKLEAFGAFIELGAGVEGLVHVSEISDRRIRHPMDVLKVDERVQVRVLEVDAARRRISLSMKAARSDAAEAVAVEAQPQKKRLGRGARVDGVVDRVENYGVFLKLFAEGTEEELGQALMPSAESGTPRGADLRKAFPAGTKLTVLIIDVDERGRLKASKVARERAEERALVEEYTKPKGGQAAGKAGLGTFGDLLKAKLGK